MDNRKIGVFDSGVGGLTVFSEIIKQLPNEDITYIGDTKRFPFGNKSKESIISISKQIVNYLILQDVKLIVIACGTATSQAIDTVSKMYNIPIIGIIEPTVNYILKQKNIKNIGVIATAGTIRSNGWEKALKEKNSELNIINKACPLLAPMAEEGWTNNEVASLAVKEYLKDINNIDALILGCTHYPLFEDVIKKELGDTVEIINTGKMIADFIKELFEKENMLNLDNNNLYEIYLTDIECNFVNVAKKLINEELSVNKTEI